MNYLSQSIHLLPLNQDFDQNVTLKNEIFLRKIFNRLIFKIFDYQARHGEMF